MDSTDDGLLAYINRSNSGSSGGYAHRSYPHSYSNSQYGSPYNASAGVGGAGGGAGGGGTGGGGGGGGGGGEGVELPPKIDRSSKPKGMRSAQERLFGSREADLCDLPNGVDLDHYPSPPGPAPAANGSHSSHGDYNAPLRPSFDKERAVKTVRIDSSNQLTEIQSGILFDGANSRRVTTVHRRTNPTTASASR